MSANNELKKNPSRLVATRDRCFWILLNSRSQQTLIASRIYAVAVVRLADFGVASEHGTHPIAKSSTVYVLFF